MNVHLTPHAAELLKAVRARRHESAEQILEEAFEALSREQQIGLDNGETFEVRRRAVSDMLDFLAHNRASLEPGVSVKDLIHEGRRI